MESSLFILDSGATDNFGHSSMPLANFKSTSDSVSLANGDHCPMVGVADFEGETVRVANLKIVPDLTHSLVSVSRLTDKGYKVVFSKERADILLNGEVVRSVPREGNLYVMRLLNEMGASDSWQTNLGYEPKPEPIQIYPFGIKAEPDFFQSCQFAQSNTDSTIQPEIRSTAPLQLVYVDLTGPHTPIAYDGSIHFLVLVDDYTRFTAVCPVASGIEVLEAFKRYHQFVERNGSYKVKMLESDLAQDFISRDFTAYLHENQIWHIKSDCNQHSVTRLAIESVRNKARANLTKSGVPQKFWSEAVMVAAQQLNSQPHSAIGNEIPYVRFFNREPNYVFLRLFGALSFALLKEERPEFMSKLEHRSRPCAMMGYQVEMKVFRLWEPINGQMISTSCADVIEGKYFKWNVGNDKKKCRQVCELKPVYIANEL